MAKASKHLGPPGASPRKKVRGHAAEPASTGRGGALRAGAWRTALTHVEPNRILIRGYPVDEAMGRVSFAEAVYLILVGELPTPAIGRLMEALLVSSIDHGTTPPSTVAARSVATTGATLRACVAAGILGFGKYHGGDIETCMLCFEEGVSAVRQGASYQEAARRLVDRYRDRPGPVPGFGHRIHSHDPRAARLFQMALELELDGPYANLARAVERELNEGRSDDERLPINVDGAIAAVCADIGLDPMMGNALFIISRVPGLIAQAHEERTRERRMRQIDATAAEYDGPAERRLPEVRTERW
jgi:citrate synthase